MMVMQTEGWKTGRRGRRKGEGLGGGLLFNFVAGGGKKKVTWNVDDERVGEGYHIP